MLEIFLKCILIYVCIGIILSLLCTVLFIIAICKVYMKTKNKPFLESLNDLESEINEYDKK